MDRHQRIYSVIIIVFCFFLQNTLLHAQSMEEEYEAFLRQRVAEMQEFKNNRDKEFANFLKENWTAYEALPGVKKSTPGPEKPIVYSPPKEVVPEKQKETPKTPKKQDVPKKKDEDKSPSQPSKRVETKNGNLKFYGGTYSIQLPNIKTYLPNVTEKMVSEAWSNIAKANYEPMVTSCLQLKKDLQLNDWGYIELAKSVANVLTSSKDSNESTFVQAFILLQSNYKIKMGTVNQRLGILMATKQDLYDVSFSNIQGERYYILPQSRKERIQTILTYKNDYSKASQRIDMNIPEPPLFVESLVERDIRADYSPLSVQAEINMNLMDFYNSMPQTEIPIYFNAAVPPKFSANVLEQFRKQLKGKSEEEQASILLQFLHQAFPYKVDAQQFGYEKPCFLEECFYYPFLDCKKRAVLYAFLIQNLLGLETVLLQYPEHIATAICFNTNVAGDYIVHNGKKFLICDPTYINAPIGSCMPSFKNTKPSVYIYNRR